MKRQVRELLDARMEAQKTIDAIGESLSASGNNGPPALPSHDVKRKRGRPRKYPAAPEIVKPHGYSIHLPTEIQKALYCLQAKRKKEEYVHYSLEGLMMQAILLLLHREGVLPSECRSAIRRFLDQPK